MDRLIKKYDYYLVAIWGILLFLPFLGAVHLFDWDEINFAESAREMLITGNFQQIQINFQPFMEKPPLFFWLQALSMWIFGVNEYAARLPNALTGMVTLLMIFRIAKTLFSRRMGFLWVLFITGSFTPHLYYKTGIIDPLYNLFIFSAIYQLFLYSKIKKAWNAILLGTFLGLAILTKGPVAVVVVLLCFITFWASQRFVSFFLIRHILLAVLFALMISSIWFAYETFQRGPVFLMEFIKYQIDLFLNPVAGHGEPFWYHPFVLLFGCFPASVIALRFLFKSKESKNGHGDLAFLKMMQILFWVVLILFSIVETKIVHYSSLCYLPVTFIAAFFMEQYLSAKVLFSKWQLFLFLFTGILISILFFALPLIDHFKEFIIPYIDDEFAVACLQINGGWNAYEPLYGLFFFIIVVLVFLQFWKNKIRQEIFVVLIFISLFIPLIMRFIVPKIERYSQGPAIDFYISKQNQNCYVETLGYKSYAQYFYTQVLPNKNMNANNLLWLQTGNIDKDVFFVLHANNVKDHINGDMIEIGRKGGFIFYRRQAIPIRAE